MRPETFADRIKYYIPPELRGIPSGLYAGGKLINKMFNPVEILRDAGGKSQQFFDSRGKDIQAGIGALADTALLGAGPVALRIGQAGKEPAKMGLKYLQELFYPLGAPSDVASQAVKISDPSKRSFLKTAGAAGILSVIPAIKGLDEVLPTTKTTKAVKASPKVVKDLKELFSSTAKWKKSWDDYEKSEELIGSEGVKIGKKIIPVLDDIDDISKEQIAVDFGNELKQQAGILFKKTNKEGRIIVDRYGTSSNRVFNEAEKQALKEGLSQTSDKDLIQLSEHLLTEDGFLHPDFLKAYLRELDIRKPKVTKEMNLKDPSHSLPPDLLTSSGKPLTPEDLLEGFDNHYALEDLPQNEKLRMQISKVLEPYIERATRTAAENVAQKKGYPDNIFIADKMFDLQKKKGPQ